MLSTPSLESYNKLKTEFTTYRTQSEDNQRELNKTIKHLKEAIELLKKENTRLKADSKDIKKLKEEKLSLSKQIMELESEAMLYKNFNGGDNLIFPSFTTTKFNFSIIENSSKQKIKDSLKNKNEEILILKNELMKKDQIISNLQKKEKEIVYSQNDHTSNYKNHIVLNQYLFRTKSESDFFHMSQNKYNKKYFGTVVSTSHCTQRGGRLSQLLSSSNKKNNDNIITVNTNNFLKRKSGDIYSELNVTMTNEGDDDGHNALEKNIYSELKNILDEKRNFILQTMTYENFSFDIISTTKKTSQSNMNNSFNSALSASTNGKNHKYSNSSTSNINPSIAFTLTKDIDGLLQIIRQRKRIVINDKKSLEEIKESNYK